MMHGRSKLLLIFLFSLCSNVAMGADGRLEVNGQVINVDTGLPQPDQEVYVLAWDNAPFVDNSKSKEVGRGTTDENGRFSFNVKSADEIQIKVKYCPNTKFGAQSTFARNKFENGKITAELKIKPSACEAMTWKK